MRKLQLLLAVIILMTLGNTVLAKSLGNYKGYQQVTDKEILIESSNGSHILISAYNDYAIGVNVVDFSEKITLTAPSKIEERSDLSGSIYVEELDELMQITTTINDGIIIKVEKNPLRLSYVNKMNSEVMFEEIAGVKFSNKSNNINFSVKSDEQLELITNNNLATYSKSINTGDFLQYGEVNQMLHPSNEICLVSSKGYALIFKAEIEHEIDFKKAEKIKISVKGEEQNSFSYLLVYGPQKPELIDKYAFHITQQDKQISLK